MYARSVTDPNGFWAEQAKRVGWIAPFTKVENSSFPPGNISIKWFEDGALNVAWNCVDRHLDSAGYHDPLYEVSLRPVPGQSRPCLTDLRELWPPNSPSAPSRTLDGRGGAAPSRRRPRCSPLRP